MAEKDWSAFDKFDYRTVKDGGGRCWSGFTSDSRKELIGRSPVMAYELGTKPRAYRGSAVNGEGAAGCSIRVHCHHSFDELERAIRHYIAYYNKQRIKAKLGWLSPVDYRLRHAAA